MKKEKLLKMETNIIDWYNLKENSSMLQIGVESLEVTKYLSEKVKKHVIAYQSEEEKNKLNKEMIKNSIRINDLDKEEKYDYVCLIGTLKVYKKDEKAYTKLMELIRIAKDKCKQNGTIILVIDNKYAMRFWTSIYATKNILCNDKFALSKTMIEEILDLEELETRKFYYVQPDYHMCNAIFTDSYLPTLDNISRNFTYAEDEFISFNQTEAYQEILKEDMKLFPFFANTYFIEIKKEGNIENTAKFVSYTNIRKEKYKIKTIIYEDCVEKAYVTENSQKHIETIKKNIDIMNKAEIKTLDTYDIDKIQSKFVKEKSYDQILIEYLKKGEVKEFFEKINEYKKYLYEKLKPIKQNNSTVFEKYNIEVNTKLKDEMNFIEHGLWDLTFQNAFYINNELYFYDQEWYEKNIPIEFIIYRAITYFAESHRYISRQEILENLGLLQMEEVFSKLDNVLQLEIRDEEIWELHTKVKTGQTLYDLYNNLITEFEDYKQIYNEQNNHELKKRITELENYNKKLLESTSWKITKPIRTFGKYLKK